MKHGEVRQWLKERAEVNLADIVDASKSLSSQTKRELKSMAGFCQQLASLVNYTANLTEDQRRFLIDSLIEDAKRTSEPSAQERRSELRAWVIFINTCE